MIAFWLPIIEKSFQSRIETLEQKNYMWKSKYSKLMDKYSDWLILNEIR